jgi:hypothetical protein
MSIYEERKEELEKFEFMMGAARGRLAVTLDVLTVRSSWSASTASTARARATQRCQPWTFN